MNKTILLSMALLALAAAARAEQTPRVQDADRATPVPAAPANRFAAPPIQEARLPNGVTLALLELRRLPLASVRILLPRAGSAADPRGQEGLSALTAELIQQGAGSMTTQAFAAAVDDIGASLSVSATSDAMVVTVLATKDHLDKALGLAAAAIRRPRLPDPEFERLKQEALATIKSEQGEPGKLAERRLDRNLYGDHPYGASRDQASVEALRPGDVKAFARRRLTPDGAVIAASGDVDMAELSRLASKHFGSWRSAPGAAVAPATGRAVAPQRAGALVIEVIDMPGSIQSAIRGGVPGPDRADAGYFPALMLHYVLGGMPISNRLEKNLRETHGWAYFARSELDALKSGGALTFQSDVQTDATADAVAEILKELQRLRDQDVPADELASIKRFVSGSFVRQQQTVQNGAVLAGRIELYGLPKDYLATYRAKIDAVTAADVRAAAQRWVSPDAVRIVITGDAAKIVPALSALATVRLVARPTL